MRGEPGFFDMDERLKRLSDSATNSKPSAGPSILRYSGAIWSKRSPIRTVRRAGGCPSIR